MPAERPRNAHLADWTQNSLARHPLRGSCRSLFKICESLASSSLSRPVGCKHLPSLWRLGRHSRCPMAGLGQRRHQQIHPACHSTTTGTSTYQPATTMIHIDCHPSLSGSEQVSGGWPEKPLKLERTAHQRLPAALSDLHGDSSGLSRDMRPHRL